MRTRLSSDGANSSSVRVSVLYNRISQSHACKQVFGALAVRGDLPLQRFEAVEFLLVAQALDETQPQLRSVQVAVEPEDVRFDDARVSAFECRTRADVRD